MSEIQTHWNKAGLAEFKSTLSQERIEEDKKKLSTLFNEAAKSPELKEALDWAASHGVEFIVDRGMGAAGMYHTGTGVLAVAEDLFKPGMREEAVVTLAHEIRHAWQDYHDLLPTYPTSFLGYYIRQAIIEADAEARGRLAGEQWYLNSLLQEAGTSGGPKRALKPDEKEDVKAALEELKKDPSELLTFYFKEWFESGAAEAYGYMTMHGMASALGLPGVEKLKNEHPVIAEGNMQPEFDPERYMNELPKENPGIQLRGPASLSVFGAGFKDGDTSDYFKATTPGFLEKVVLSPRLAASFYQAGARPHPMVEAILREEREWERQQRHRGGFGFGFTAPTPPQPGFGFAGR